MSATVSWYQDWTPTRTETRQLSRRRMLGRVALVLHSLRGFPHTDVAARLPLELSVAGRLRSDVPGRFWFCRVPAEVWCRLDESSERGHIDESLLSDDEGSLRLTAVVITPAAANQVLQPGIFNLAVHAAAVLDPRVGESGVVNAAQVGYLGCALLNDSTHR